MLSSALQTMATWSSEDAALKGRLNAAQGNALGAIRHCPQALKGRVNCTANTAERSMCTYDRARNGGIGLTRPFRASGMTPNLTQGVALGCIESPLRQPLLRCEAQGCASVASAGCARATPTSGIHALVGAEALGFLPCRFTYISVPVPSKHPHQFESHPMQCRNLTKLDFPRGAAYTFLDGRIPTCW